MTLIGDGANPASGDRGVVQQWHICCIDMHRPTGCMENVRAAVLVVRVVTLASTTNVTNCNLLILCDQT